MHRVFVDSNVLGSKTPYDWLFMLKLAGGVFSIVTSEDVFFEAHRVWRRKYHDAGSDLHTQRDALLREMFDEVLTEWDGGAAPSLKDSDDTHVHNAARHAGVDILLTNNVPDFSDPDLLPYDLYTPDQFFTLMNMNHPSIVRSVAREQALYWAERNQGRENPRSLKQSLVPAGCPEFAEAVGADVHALTGAV